MPLRLKSRQKACPNGFMYEQKETGWKNWQADPATQWDFNALCRAVQQHRLANKGRYPYLQTHYKLIEEEIDQVNAERVSMIPNAFDEYVMDTGGGLPKSVAPLSQPLAAVGASLAKISKGAKGLDEWRKSGEIVDRTQAEARAAVCVGCHENSDRDWRRFFIAPVAAVISAQLEWSTEMKLETSQDEKLNVCKACGCPMKVKVHCPGKFIAMGMTPSIKSELAPQCWILSEGI